MADTLTKVVNLLAMTDGRDKLYKLSVGLVKLSATYSTTKENQKKLSTMAKSLGEGRSLMRMCKWVGNYNKLKGFAGKINRLTSRELVEIIRVIGDFGYIFGDNLAYLSKYGVLPFDPTTCGKNSKIFQFWGYSCAIILDLWSIVLLRAKKAKGDVDSTTFRKQSRDLYLSLTKNFADWLATLNAVGYAKNFYKPTPAFVACCGATSGAIATYTNWKKVSK